MPTDFEKALNEFCRSSMPLGWNDSSKCRSERDALWAAHQASVTALQAKLADAERERDQARRLVKESYPHLFAPPGTTRESTEEGTK